MQLPAAFGRHSVLVIGDGSRAVSVAAGLRAEGFHAATVTTVSEICQLLAEATVWPTLAIFDGCVTAPWRADALGRMAEIASDARIPFVRIGDARLMNATAEVRAVMAGDAGVASIVRLVRALGEEAPTTAGA